MSTRRRRHRRRSHSADAPAREDVERSNEGGQPIDAARSRSSTEGQREDESSTAGGARTPRAEGTRRMSAVLENGRNLWLESETPLATAGEADGLREAVQWADLREASGQRDNDLALRALSAQLDAEVGALSKQRAEMVDRLAQQLAEGDNELGLRLERELDEARPQVESDLAELDEHLSRAHRRALWDSILLLGVVPLFRTYGQRVRPWDTHNRWLGLSTLGWLLGDELLERLSGESTIRSTELRPGDLWSYVAPVGSFLTGWLLLRNRQHLRFVTGMIDTWGSIERTLIVEPPDEPAEPVDPPEPDVEPVDPLPVLLEPNAARYRYRVLVDLEPHLASGHVDAFRDFVEVSAVATLVASGWVGAMEAAGFEYRGLTARVLRLSLIIDLSVVGPVDSESVDDLPMPRVAWMVDTQDPGR